MLALVLALLLQDAAPAPLPPGEVLYNFRCKGCHEYDQPGIPAPAALRALSPEAVIRSLETGSMKAMGSSMTTEEKQLVAEYVTGKAAARR